MALKPKPDMQPSDVILLAYYVVLFILFCRIYVMILSVYLSPHFVCSLVLLLLMVFLLLYFSYSYLLMFLLLLCQISLVIYENYMHLSFFVRNQDFINKKKLYQRERCPLEGKKMKIT